MSQTSQRRPLSEVLTDFRASLVADDFLLAKLLGSCAAGVFAMLLVSAFFVIATLTRVDPTGGEAAASTGSRLFAAGAAAAVCLLGLSFLIATMSYSFVAFRRHVTRLQTARENTRSIIAATLDCVLTFDGKGIVRSINPAGEKIFGHAARAIIGRPLALLIPGRVFIGEKGALIQGARHAIGQRRTGDSFPLELSLSEMYCGDQRRFVAIIRDVTERQHAEEERRKAERLDCLGAIAGGVAHDFNNLLTAILGNLSLALFTRSGDDELCERLTSAKAATLRAQELAQQLLTFTTGGKPLKANQDVAAILRQAVDFTLHGSNIRSQIDVPSGLWTAEVDASQLTQVFANLTLNAQQAMPDGGTLHITCANRTFDAEHTHPRLPAGDYLEITMRDHGAGIAPENLAKIFEPYFSTKPKGAGLGLSTSLAIIKNHAGHLELISEPGAGTIARILVPAIASVPAEKIIEPFQIEPHQPARVLILDDEQPLCELVACVLEPMGYEVAQTHDGADAIEAYRAAMLEGHPFDVVICDLTIPGGMGGLDTIRHLREIDPGVKAIVCSGYNRDPIVMHFRDHGFSAMLAKPYDIKALGRTVAEVITSPAAGKVITHDFVAKVNA